MKLTPCIAVAAAAAAVAHAAPAAPESANLDSSAPLSHQLSPRSTPLLPRMNMDNHGYMPEDHHNHGLPILEHDDLTPEEREYWEEYNATSFLTADAPRKPFLYAHMATVSAAFLGIYPVSLMFSTANSPWYLLVLTAHVATVYVALACLAIYGATAPHLYPNNAYAKMSWIVAVATAVHYAAALVKTLAAMALHTPLGPAFEPLVADEAEAEAGIPLEQYDAERGSQSPSTLYDTPGTPDSVGRSSADSRETTVGSLDSLTAEMDGKAAAQAAARAAAQRSVRPAAPQVPKVLAPLVARAVANERIGKIVAATEKASRVLYALLNRPMLVFASIYLCTGLAVVNCMGISNDIYNLLAHFIKGGVFVWLGVVTLGRYMGCWQDVGFAWNRAAEEPRLRSRKAGGLAGVAQRAADAILPEGLLTMEFIESFMVFFYGITNVFMEHLGNQDGKWSAKDLQHASIAFMFIGGGLCGLISEYKLSSWRRNTFYRLGGLGDCGAVYRGVTPGFSPNPFPAMIVFWAGVLMSQHQQALPLSTLIHEQWGYTLCAGAFFRLGTYVLMYLKPPAEDGLPCRPFTELLTSFTLLLGGSVFMESNSETVFAMIYRGLNAMFTLNVSVGIVALAMGWIMVVISIKDRLMTQV